MRRNSPQIVFDDDDDFVICTTRSPSFNATDGSIGNQSGPTPPRASSSLPSGEAFSSRENQALLGGGSRLLSRATGPQLLAVFSQSAANAPVQQSSNSSPGMATNAWSGEKPRSLSAESRLQGPAPSQRAGVSKLPVQTVDAPLDTEFPALSIDAKQPSPAASDSSVKVVDGGPPTGASGSVDSLGGSVELQVTPEPKSSPTPLPEINLPAPRRMFTIPLSRKIEVLPIPFRRPDPRAKYIADELSAAIRGFSSDDKSVGFQMLKLYEQFTGQRHSVRD